MKLVVMGAPGAGKGTQAYFLSQHYQVPHISTGELLREHMKNKTSIGIEIEDLMNRGQLVPDDVAVRVFKERIGMDDCQNGYILDGFPRTLYQAEIMEEIAGKLESVVLVHVDDEIIVERMNGRRICTQCGSTYHLTYKPPHEAGKCDHCGEKLTQRIDDKAKTVRERLRIYHSEAEPIRQYYESNGMLLTVEGIGEIDDITQRIVKALDA